MANEIPGSVGELIARLEARIERLELSRRLESASIGAGGLEVTGGKIVVKDPADVERFAAGQIADGVYGIRVATADGAPAFEVTDASEVPPTAVDPAFIANDTRTETLNVAAASGWVDLATSQHYPAWQREVATSFFASNSSVAETVEARLFDKTAGALIGSVYVLEVNATPQGVTLRGDVPYDVSTPAGTDRQFAVQVRVTTAGPAAVEFEIHTGAFRFTLGPTA